MVMHYNYRNIGNIKIIVDFIGVRADLIFFTNITNYICGEKIVTLRNFSFPCIKIVGKLKISPHVEEYQMSPHDRFGEI